MPPRAARSLDEELAASRAAVAAAAEAHQIVSKPLRGRACHLSRCPVGGRRADLRPRAEAELETRALILDVSLVRALGGGFSPELGPNPITPNLEPKHS